MYIVTDYVQNDLRSMLKMGEVFSLDDIRKIMHQLLQALAYLHFNNVIHRDLKPENLLITKEGDVKVCDLGLARRADPDMTGYLATRYYRAPEFMLTWRNYGAAVDIWSAGCILAELATGTVLFPATDHVTHIRLITELLGSPSALLMRRICSPNTIHYLSLLPQRQRANFYELYGERLGVHGVDLLSRMLEFDPNDRISPREALFHPFFNGLSTHPCHDKLMAGPMVNFMEWSNSIELQAGETNLEWSTMLRHELMKCAQLSPNWGNF